MRVMTRVAAAAAATLVASLGLSGVAAAGTATPAPATPPTVSLTGAPLPAGLRLTATLTDLPAGATVRVLHAGRPMTLYGASAWSLAAEASRAVFTVRPVSPGYAPPLTVSITTARGETVTSNTLEMAPLDTRDNLVIGSYRLGTTVRGRAIMAYRKGNPNASLKVVVLGQMHGTEPKGKVMADYLISSVPVSLSADVWVIPTINPDGSAAGARTNAHHVDLNRNFPRGWIYRDSPSSVGYAGPSPASEPETRALMAFLDKINPRYVVSVHQPLYAVDSDAAKDPSLARRLAANTGLPLKPLTCGGACHGTASMWFNAYHPGAMITIEMSASPSAAFVRQTAVAILKSTYAY